ncbi:MAG: imidazole glycerol phosphate synthase subunit HisH [Cypionkella sp.]
MDIALIDAGGANLGSVRYAFERLGIMVRVVRDADGLAGAERVVLPGVGAAAPAMAALHERGFVQALRASAKPLLGICLGMQLLYQSSDEGGVDCLGLIPGQVRKMQPQPGVRIPHMGWNALHHREAGGLLEGIGDGEPAYFVHGYAAAVDANTLATTRHGMDFAAIVCHGHHVGMQFHPERSSALGAQLLRNFISWQP